MTDVPVAERFLSAESNAVNASTRPGLVTALGVTSIVAAVFQAGWAVTFFVMACGLWIVSVAVPALTPATVVASSSSPDGLPLVQTVQITQRVDELAPLTPARRMLFETLLLKYGRDIAPIFVTADITPETVRKFVTSVGKTPDGNDFLNVNDGRIELSDLSATFEPEGTRDITTVYSSDAPDAIRPEAATTAPVVAQVPPPPVGAGPVLLLFSFLTPVASALMAILMLIAGILALRNRRGAGPTHLWWACLKIPIGFVGTFVTAGVFRVFAKATPPPDATGEAFATLLGASIGIASLIHAVAVILVLRARTVRAWFDSRH